MALCGVLAATDEAAAEPLCSHGDAADVFAAAVCELEPGDTCEPEQALSLSRTLPAQLGAPGRLVALAPRVCTLASDAAECGFINPRGGPAPTAPPVVPDRSAADAASVALAGPGVSQAASPAAALGAPADGHPRELERPPQPERSLHDRFSGTVTLLQEDES